MRRLRSARALLLGLAVASMVAGLYAGLVRLGLALPAAPELADIHGPLMVCGVFGTLISLERAVAIGLGWPYVAPAGFVVSAVLMLAGGSASAAFVALSAAAVFLAASVWIAARQRAMFTAVLVVAVAMLAAGCTLWWWGMAVAELAAWWLGFLVLTIAAERLELSRVMRPDPLSRWLFGCATVAVVAGAAFGLLALEGRVLLGAGFVGIAAWLARHDVAMRTVRMRGQPRFMAAAMLAGYAWLAITGLTLVSGWLGSFSYDLALHGVLIGFVLSMVFGHALIIFPAIGGVMLEYRPALYAPLLLLHLSVAMRAIGDVLELETVRLLSGPLTVLALVAFGATLALGRASISRR